tara:strand:- start:180 stop:1625 length:1446 start_codon:yes stop_codon:yes gene_type:complete
MNQFTDTINEKTLGLRNDYGLTFNGMATRTSSLDLNTDLFFQIGSSRNQDIRNAFSKAFQHNPDLALRTALWARDVREGAGERQTFRSILLLLEKTLDHDAFLLVLRKVPELGRWDDLLVLDTREGQNMAAKMIQVALSKGDGLCAKWMPRKGLAAARLRERLGWSPKFYRKTLVNLTNVVETQMCNREWNEIEFGKVPSLAASRYQRAFNKRVPEAYMAYREGLEKGTEKVNAGAVYPYDVLKPVVLRDYGWDEPKYSPEVVKAQWEALPNLMGNNNMLAMVDVSGSMYCQVGGNANLTCILVALSLGLYIADKQSGAFKDTFLTFSGNPELLQLRGDILSKMKAMNSSDWGMNTDLMRAMKKILDHAVKNRVPAEDMPKTLVILSDMEFDYCASVGYNLTALEATNVLFRQAGYTRPNIVFWNLNAREGNVPVRFDEAGTALVSGFSPNILKSILAGEDMTPEAIMLKTLMVDRYNIAA